MLNIFPTQLIKNEMMESYMELYVQKTKEDEIVSIKCIKISLLKIIHSLFT